MNILKRFSLMKCKVITTPMVSNLKLLCDVSLDTFDDTMFLTDLIHVHQVAAKHVLRYLKSTVDYGLKYYENQNINIHGYVDSY